LNPLKSLSHVEQLKLATSLEETVETANGIFRLRQGIANAYIAGTLDDPGMVVVQSRFLLEEPALFGRDARLAWQLLQLVPEWTAVNAEAAVAPELAAIIDAETGGTCVLIEEFYYELHEPVRAFSHPDVRRFTMDDLALVESATESLDMAGWRLGTAKVLLRDGFLAGAVVNGELVSIAFTASRTGRYGEIGIKTRADYRGRGYSTAAASLVTADVQASGEIAFWSTDQDNAASQRVAEKLGFTEVSRRIYVNR
jgi:predicted GNAT family acetyltransferase